jgi:ribosomal protein L7/L12
MFELFGRSPDFTAADAARLRRVEAKLDLILAHLGVPFTDEADQLPEAARQLAESGDKIAAIKAYREATGAGLAEAKRAVEVFLVRQTR